MSHFSRYFVLWMGCLALASAFAEEPAGLEGLAKTVKYEDGFHVEVVDEVTFFRQLQKFDSREDFCLQLHESLKSESDSERLAALKVIEKFEERLQFSETQLRTFVQILDTDESPTCRCLAMDILVHFRAKGCIPSLLLALEDSSPDVASSAAWALGELAPPSEEVLQALLRHTADSREVVTSVTIDVYIPQPVVAQASLNALEKLAVGNVEVYDSILREQIPPEVWKSFDEKKLETFFERIASPDLREEEFWRHVAEVGLDRFPTSDSLPVVILFTLRPEDPRSLYLYLSRKLTKAKGDISNVYPSDFYDVPQTRPVFFAMRTCWQHREARDVDWHKIEWKFIRQSFRKELNKNEFESRCRDALDFLEGVDDSYFRAWWTRDFLYGLPAWQPEYFELYERC